jgi:hypothetical protein
LSASGLKVVVGGMFAGVPFQGGATWAVMQYVLGLRDLGHDVLLIETVDPPTLEDPIVTSYFGSVVEEFGLEGRAVLLGRNTTRTHGCGYRFVLSEAKQADLLLNLSGSITDEVVLALVGTRVYVDLDPAFTQLWNAVSGIDLHFEGHDRFATVGLALGSDGCAVPSCGREWITTLPPVFLKSWPHAAQLDHAALTTVGNWRSYGSIEHEGVLYAQKAHSLRKLITLPKCCDENFLLAMAIDEKEDEDLRALHANGWQLVDDQTFPRTPAQYRRFVQGSKAEFGVAKSGYVVSGSGWFSDRSACYLASGRPVVAQDTGFSAYLPCGKGLLAFCDTQEAAQAVGEIAGAYDTHRKAARDLAEEYLDAAKVLPALIEAAGGSR